MNKTLVWQTASPQSSHPLPPQFSLWRRWRNNTYTPAPTDGVSENPPAHTHTHLFFNNPHPLDRPNNSVLHKSTEEVPNWPKETGRSSIPRWKRPFIFMFLAEIWWVDTENRTVLFGAVLVPRGGSEDIYVRKAALLSCPPSGQKHWQTLQRCPSERNHKPKGITSSIHPLLPLLYFLKFTFLSKLFRFFFIVLSPLLLIKGWAGF